ncbi:sulfatase-like hydrolase/transferase [uncultured Polaribacter sp.]|uniref:sulfatase-like hydrolase/transferase n=1 Tax=uncultured Polaribacter sp. TaxID=174711 RepID=UPI0026283392|nr:sulfatase-like hydrolase/transferase [uncultured Polaribacter sp.]
MNRIVMCTVVFFTIVSCKTKKMDTSKTTSENDRLPNLVIVLSDQHSADMVGAYGNKQLITPNLDKLASEGVLLENAFASQPVCTPFRGMLMSGMHPLKNGAFVNDVPLLPNKTKLMAEILKEKGYQTAYFGKWHLLGGNRDRGIPKEMTYGFDKVLTNNCHVDFRPGKAFFWNEKGEKEFFNEWEPYAQTNQAIDYLNNIDPSKPFAIILSLHPPHDWGKFKGEDGKMHYRYDTLDELMALYERNEIILRPGLEDTPDRRRMYHGHMAQITGIDIAVGNLMTQLKNMNVEKNTLVAFTADHGDMLESHNAKLPKQYPHDYSNKIPFIIKYPGKIKSGFKSKSLLGTMDILPTLLSFMNIETQESFDGLDLSRDILNNKLDKDDYVPIWNYRIGRARNSNWRGVETDRYTFSTSKESNNSMINTLFDREKDPGQLNNLYNNPAYKNIQAKLEGYTKEWMQKYDDQFYGAKEFNAVQPKSKWTYNYEYSPLELLNKKREYENK